MDTEQYDREFRRQAQDRVSRGQLLLGVMVFVWLWFAWLLFMPYERQRPGYPSSVECDAPMLEDGVMYEQCLQDPRWPLVALAGGIAALGTIVATACYLSGHLQLRASQHHEAMRTLPRP